MTKSNKFRGLTASIAVAALFASQPAVAEVIEINSMWAGSDIVTINYAGSPSMTALASAGGFKTINQTNVFQSFCVDIFDMFTFSTVSNDTLHLASDVISSRAAEDLGKLYTNHHNVIDSTSSSAENEAAFQLAVWEIVNEEFTEFTGYSLGSGIFTAQGNQYTKTGAVSLANAWLAALGTSSYNHYNAYIWKVDSMLATGTGTGYAQDVVTFTAVPEPETYAMMLVGLGLLGFSARRKNQNMV